MDLKITELTNLYPLLKEKVYAFDKKLVVLDGSVDPSAITALVFNASGEPLAITNSESYQVYEFLNGRVLPFKISEFKHKTLTLQNLQNSPEAESAESEILAKNEYLITKNGSVYLKKGPGSLKWIGENEPPSLLKYLDNADCCLELGDDYSVFQTDLIGRGEVLEIAAERVKGFAIKILRTLKSKQAAASLILNGKQVLVMPADPEILIDDVHEFKIRDNLAVVGITADGHYCDLVAFEDPDSEYSDGSEISITEISPVLELPDLQGEIDRVCEAVELTRVIRFLGTGGFWRFEPKTIKDLNVAVLTRLKAASLLVKTGFKFLKNGV